MARPDRVRLVVLFGGRSAEHDVSCTSALNVLRAADRDRYDVVPVGITREGRWVGAADAVAALDAGARALPSPDTMPATAEVEPLPAVLPASPGEQVVVLPLLHGPMGEDGTVQGLCELADVPYVGPGVAASAVCMDKGLAKAVLAAHGIPQCGWLGVREQAPFYTTGGAGVFTGDYYMISASRRWFDRQPKATQDALTKVIAETIQVQKEYNWCVDRMTYAKYGTKDPSKPGVYWMTPDEVSKLTSALGDGPNKWKKSRMPAAAHQLVDNFTAEGKALSQQNPPGSSWIEKVDCSKHASKIVIK